MKISSVSKKVLASALSAAMVVAFAPTVAFAGVIEEAGDSQAEEQPVVSGETVATVTYFAKKIDTGVITKYTEEFKATDEASYDNAVQAALIYANNLKPKTGYALQSGAKYPVTVQLQKDVTVDAVYGTNVDENGTTVFAKSVWNANTDKNGNYTTDSSKVVEASSALIVDGTLTIDLNGHKLTNASNAAAKGECVETGVLVTGDQSIFDDGLRTLGATKSESKFLLKSAVDDMNTDELKAALTPSGAGTSLTSYTKKSGTYYVSGMDENGKDTYTAVAAGEDTSGLTLYYGYDITYKTATSYKAGKSEVGGTITLTDSVGGGAIESADEDAVATACGDEDHKLVLGNITIAATGDFVVRYVEGDTIPAGKNVGDIAYYSYGASAVYADDVLVEGAATLSSKSKTSVAALWADNVVVADAAGKITGASLNVTAEATEAETNDNAVAIFADDSYIAYKQATVTATATANGKGATVDKSTGTIIDTIGDANEGGILDGTTTDNSKGAALNVHSFAVMADEVNIETGKYGAEYAVANGSETYVSTGDNEKLSTTDTDDVWSYTNDCGATGVIKYGEFTGHVYGEITNAAKTATENLTIDGGIYSENPDATAYTFKVGGESVTKYWNNNMGTNMAVATDGSKFYAYKKASLNAGNYDAEHKAYFDNKSTYKTGQGTDATNAYIAVGDTDAYNAAIAKGETATGIAEWANSAVESLALGKAVSGVALSGDAAAIQAKLINGNYGTAERTVVLTIAPKRVDEAVAAEAEASKTLIDAVKATAADEGASVQGFYTISASLSQGYDKYATAANETAAANAKATSIAAVNDMGDTKVKVTVRPVSLNAGAKALTAEGTATELSSKTAVVNNAAGDAWMETSNLAPFGVTYGSNVVSQSEIAKLMAQIAELQEKLGIALDGTVDTAENLKAQLANLQNEVAINKVKGATKTVKLGNKSKTSKAKTVTLKAVTSDSGAKATFKKTSGSSKVSVAKSGKATLKKGVKKGTYTAKVKASIGSYTKIVTVKFVVKK